MPVTGPLGAWLQPLISLSISAGANVKDNELAILNLRQQFVNVAQSKAFLTANRKGQPNRVFVAIIAGPLMFVAVTLHGRLWDVQEGRFDPNVQYNTSDPS
jgi:hypothetical protein